MLIGPGPSRGGVSVACAVSVGRVSGILANVGAAVAGARLGVVCIAGGKGGRGPRGGIPMEIGEIDRGGRAGRERGRRGWIDGEEGSGGTNADRQAPAEGLEGTPSKPRSCTSMVSSSFWSA